MAYYPCESKHKKYKLRIDYAGGTWTGVMDQYFNSYAVYIIDTSTNTITFSQGSLKTNVWYANSTGHGNSASIKGVSLTEIK